MKTREEILKEKYGFSKASYKYIPKGAEILKSIGQVVICVDYTRQEDGTWKTEYQKALIIKISDFDPLTMTYKCKYKIGEDGDEQELQIIPEGYSWGNPEETGWMKRFLPYSLHCQFVEDELFYSHLADLYESKKTLDIEFLFNLSQSKEKKTQLKYSRHISAVIRLSGEKEVLYFRIQDITLRHKSGKSYSLKISDGENSYTFMITSDQEEYDFENIGKIKIIDLCTN